MSNLGQFREKSTFCLKLLNQSLNLKILLHICDAYNCNHLPHITFRFYLIDFQLNNNDNNNNNNNNNNNVIYIAPFTMCSRRLEESRKKMRFKFVFDFSS